MAADGLGDISPGREEGRSSSPSNPNNARGGAGEFDAGLVAVQQMVENSGLTRGAFDLFVQELDRQQDQIDELQRKRRKKSSSSAGASLAALRAARPEDPDAPVTQVECDLVVQTTKQQQEEVDELCAMRWNKSPKSSSAPPGNARGGAGASDANATELGGVAASNTTRDDEYPTGYGIITYPDIDGVYEGGLKNGIRHGRGITRIANKEVYNGEWVDGKMTGRGRYTYTAGGVYEGEMRDAVRHGRGSLRWEDGRIYEGEWREGKQHGWGTFNLGGGRFYEGEFEHGKTHGFGTMTYEDGNVYEGQWVEGGRHGKGTVEYASGEVIDGVWVGGLRIWAEARVTAPGADTEKQQEKEKRVYIHRTLRSAESQQRRLQRANVTTKDCEHCGADDIQYKLRACSGCNLALYCSAACQKAGRRSHQRICDIISELPSKDSDKLTLEFDREKMVDLDARLRYATKYMADLKHVVMNGKNMASSGTLKFSAKQLSSLLSSKKGALESYAWLSDRPGFVNDNVLKKLHGLKQLRLEYVNFDDVQPLCDMIGQQKNTLLVLGLPYLDIAWQKTKCRRKFAQAIGACKHLVNLDLRECVLPDSDLKVMLQDLPNLRILNISRHPADTHGITDNTCGLIARKCPGLQELCITNHDQLTTKGIRKIFAGCVHLRSFCATRKLSCKDIRGLLDTAPQLILLATDDEMGVSNGELAQIIEATGGRTYLRFGERLAFDYDNISAKVKERYERQQRVVRDALRRRYDPEVANEWEELFEG